MITLESDRPISASAESADEHASPRRDFAIDSEEFLASISGVTDTPFQPGNRIDILTNGDEIYPPMLEAIEGAERSITIEAYIYWGGEIGLKFAKALAAKARAGLPVKILLDSVGSFSIGREILAALEEGGCEVEWYHPVFWYTVDRINNRTHRKSLIVDGRIGFTGGAGIADHWLGNAEDPEHWRDTQVRIEGPAVAMLQAAFVRNWHETTGELVAGPAFFRKHDPAGHLSALSILSWPETGSSTIRAMYELSIECARSSIWIANPYFIPDDEAITALCAAKHRGVDVKIMVAGKYNDNRVARLNGTRLYGKLLEAGVEILEYDRTMMHHKYMVCDGVWSTVGTANFDNRSFSLNDENNVCVSDRPFAAEWEKRFRIDMEACRVVTLDAWRHRGLLTRIGEFFVSVFRWLA